MKKTLTLFISLTTLSVSAQVEISGTVKNYSDSIFYIKETGGFHNFTRVWRDNSVKVKIDKTRHFKAIIPEESIGSWYIKAENGNQIFEIVKGKNLVLTADFLQETPLHAVGENADDFNYSAYLKDHISKYYVEKKFWDKISNKNIDSNLFYRKELASFQLNLLNKYKSSRKMSEVYYHWLQSQYTYEPFERTLVDNTSNQDSLDSVAILKILEKGTNDDYAALNTTAYNDLVSFYITSKINHPGDSRNPIYCFDFVVKTNILTGSTKDVYLSRCLAAMIKFSDSIYNPRFEKYDKIVTDEKMKQYVINRRNDYTNTTTSSFTVDAERANSISDIFKKYQGKVIYIDFWASWCIPCRQEMPNAADLKEKLKGKNVVFLYFGYNDKEKAWIKARNQLNIEGEHYLLNEKMVKEADELFGINGIPHYAIIDKNGRVISKRADYPGVVYTQLFNLQK